MVASSPPVRDWSLLHSPYRATGLVLLLVPLLGPVWNVVVVPLPAVSATIGRVAIVLAALLLVVDWLRDGAHVPTFTHATLALAGLLVLILGWIALSSTTWGCRCANEVDGFSEIAAVAVLAVALATLEPRLRAPLMIAAIGGALVAAAAALAGVPGLSAGVRGPAVVHGRLAGPFGNPNSLAFGLALAVPSLMVYRAVTQGRPRLLALGALLVVLAALALTLSRGGILAAGAGAAAVAVLAAEPGRARLRMSVTIVVALAAGGLIYPQLRDIRSETIVPDPDPSLKAIDASGWDARAEGLVARGSATMSNPSAGELRVATSQAGQGVSRGWGAARSRERYRLRLSLRATTGRQRVSIGLEDNLRANGPAMRTVSLTSRWRTILLRWRPNGESPNARLYAWSPDGTGDFRMANIALAGPDGVRRISTRLRGSLFARDRDARVRAQAESELQSRWAGVQLAFQAFWAQPVRGIGWGNFPPFADARRDFGPVPTHDEYLRFLAELGAVGFLLLGGLVLAVWLAVLHGPRDALAIAVVGVLVAGAMGLLFINGLVAAAVAMPLAIAAAVGCARAAPRPDERELSSLWPSRQPSRAVLADLWAVGRAAVAASRRLRRRGRRPA